MDLSGKTALITGVNSGIGYETMRVLALRGAHVLGTARDPEKARKACANVEGRASPLVLELADPDSVVACAREVDAMDVSIDMLICNAGVLLAMLQQVRGLEMHFVVNHLGHFLLVNRLLHRVTSAPQGRVVIVGSDAHRSAPAEGIRFDALSGEGWFDRRTAYGHSKLANGLFSKALARRLVGTRATSNCLHPGVVRTNIARNLPAWQEMLFRVVGGLFLKSLAEGAATNCYVATDPTLAAVSGCYFADCNPATPSAQMRDDDMAERLWHVSMDLVREYL
jgi:WW domain-containing oxidoreductase